MGLNKGKNNSQQDNNIREFGEALKNFQSFLNEGRGSIYAEVAKCLIDGSISDAKDEFCKNSSKFLQYGQGFKSVVLGILEDLENKRIKRIEEK